MHKIISGEVLGYFEYFKNKELSLYLPWTNNSNIALNGCGYGDAHYSLVPMNDWGVKETLQEFKTTSITFDTLCKNYEITKIDYLQIDTEGFDTEIIQMIDFTKYVINTIRYEKWQFDSSCFTEHNISSAKNLGQMV